MALQSDTLAAVETARSALATALTAIHAARLLWSRDEPTNPRMAGTFPFSSHVPTDPVGGNALLAQTDADIARVSS